MEPFQRTFIAKFSSADVALEFKHSVNEVRLKSVYYRSHYYWDEFIYNYFVILQTKKGKQFDKISKIHDALADSLPVREN